MATLFSATLDLAKILGNVIESVTSGAGTTTTLVDTNFPRTAPPDDAYNYGTLWFITGDLAGKTAVVTDWTQSSKTFTFATQTAAPGASKRYAFLDKDYPRDVLRQAVNMALQTIGGVPDIYTLSTFVTVANQEDYTLPAGVYNVKKVEIATSDTAPYYYQKHYHWTEVDGVIRFKNGYAPTTAGDLIRLTYIVPPEELDDDADPISDYVHPDRLKWTAAVHALLWKLPAMGEQSQAVNQKLQMATQMERMMATRHRLPTASKITLSRWA
jgi:hypothetical protein